MKRESLEVKDCLGSKEKRFKVQNDFTPRIYPSNVFVFCFFFLMSIFNFRVMQVLKGCQEIGEKMVNLECKAREALTGEKESQEIL